MTGRVSNLVKVFETSRETSDRLSIKKDMVLAFEDVKDLPSINLDVGKKHQMILGFGGAFTDENSYLYTQLNPIKKSEIINAYFHPKKGLRFSLCRTDIQEQLNPSLKKDHAQDMDYPKLSGREDDKTLLISFIKSAFDVEGADIKLLAAWKREDQYEEVKEGSALQNSLKREWEYIFRKYIKIYRKEGIPIWGFTIQNEPDIRQAAGSTHDKVCGDILYRMDTDALLSGELTDLKLNTQNNSRININLPARMPEKAFSEWEYAEFCGDKILEDLNNSRDGWLERNMLSDKNNSRQKAPILVDFKKRQVFYDDSYFYIGHFSKFILPGAHRLECRSDLDELKTTAFENKDGSIAAVVLNRSGVSLDYQLKVGGKAAQAKSPPHSITTLLCNSFAMDY